MFPVSCAGDDQGSDNRASFLVQGNQKLFMEPSIVILAGVSGCSWSCSSCPAPTLPQTGPGLALGPGKAALA